MCVRTAMNDGRSVTFFADCDRLIDRRDVVAVVDVDQLRVPSAGVESRDRIVGERDVRRPRERDEVVVVEDDRACRA